MKALKSLFTAIVALCCVACSKGTMTPVTEKINGPLGDFFEVVSRDYATKDGEVSIEIKRIKDGFPSPWRKGMEVGHNDGCFEPEFIVEFQDADGNVVSKDNTDIVWDSDELEMIASLGVDESATITFDCDKKARKFKISSKFKVNGEQERTISMEGSIGKYPIAMTIHIAPDASVTGAYYYKSSGRGNYLYVKGKKSDDRITLDEYTKDGKQTGSYSGIFKGDAYKGRFDAESGSYDFTLKAADMEAIDFSYVDFDSFYAKHSSSSDDFDTDDYADYDSDYDDDSYGSSTGSAEWDEILDTYEQYVNKYVSLMKKAAKGDLTALAEYPALMQKAQKLSTKLENAKSDLSASQLGRYMAISTKMLEAIQEME